MIQQMIFVACFSRHQTLSRMTTKTDIKKGARN